MNIKIINQIFYRISIITVNIIAMLFLMPITLLNEDMNEFHQYLFGNWGCVVCFFFVRSRLYLSILDTIDILYLVYLNFCTNKIFKV